MDQHILDEQLTYYRKRAQEYDETTGQTEDVQGAFARARELLQQHAPVEQILERVTGMKAALFADRTLFATLGIWRDKDIGFAWKQEGTGPHTWHEDALWDEQDGYPWKVTLQGMNTGGFGAHFTAREMAELGFLYLNHGQWDGIQVIPEDYIAASTRKQSNGGPPLNAHYGYLWWIEQVRGMHAFFASGFGGKYIYVMPELDLVVVTTASTQQAYKDPEQHNKIRALIPNFILPALSH